MKIFKAIFKHDLFPGETLTRKQGGGNSKTFFGGRRVEKNFGFFFDDPPSLSSEIFSDGKPTYTSL